MLSGPRPGLCYEGVYSQVAGSLLQPGEALGRKTGCDLRLEVSSGGARKGRGEGPPQLRL